MKKYILISLILASCCIAASAKEPTKGYRGFVDANVDLSFNQSVYGETTVVYYGVSTSHGYQFNPHLFVGAGLVLERHHPVSHNYGYEFPIFAHARTDWQFGRFPLYGDIRIGGVILGDDRLYISPTVGYRLNLGGKSNLNFGIGLNLRGYRWGDESSIHPQLAIRAGIDF